MNRNLVLLMGSLLATGLWAKTFNVTDYGIEPGKPIAADAVEKLLAEVKAETEPSEITFPAGTYEVTAESCQKRTWYISNHDQWNPKKVFLPLEGLKDVTIQAEGAFFNLHGRIIPVGIWNSEAVTLQGVTLDYDLPPLTQITFTDVNAEAKTVTFRPIAGTQTELVNGELFFKGPDFRFRSTNGILFDPVTFGRIVYRTGDCGFNLRKVTDNGDGTFTATDCANGAFKVGQAMALRDYGRPAPGVVISDSKDIALKQVTIHYADGMGVLAQATENLLLDGVCIVPNKAKGRWFSTQADATHFSGCKGEIRSINGTYVGMMDDAINVHGTYLRVEKRLDDHTLECRYMHHQSYGFTWGEPGDTISVVQSRPMEALPKTYTLKSCEPIDATPVQAGAKRFRLTFTEPLAAEIDPAKTAFGVENLTWTPSVHFENNTIANNRARGALFSTPKRVVCIRNRFDHTSGCAILLCGDCNGWYETGACTDVLIRENTFINALTSPFQFTEAVISICPEIPELKKQTRPLHSNVVIEYNSFITFDNPLVYAKSVDGLTIRKNYLTKTTDYAPYHWHKQWLTTVGCRNVQAEKPEEVCKKLDKNPSCTHASPEETK